MELEGGEEAAVPGLDEAAAAAWYYPAPSEAFPVRRTPSDLLWGDGDGEMVRREQTREYQRSMAREALFANSLVCLPTGLGKTLIAAVVMYNFYRCGSPNRPHSHLNQSEEGSGGTQAGKLSSSARRSRLWTSRSRPATASSPFPKLTLSI